MKSSFTIAGTVRTVSKRWSGTQAEKGEIVVDVDRSNPILGNPHPMRDKSLSERDRVIALNNRRVDEDMAVAGPIAAEIDRLAHLVNEGHNLALSCWCAPCPCHGDRYVQEILKRVQLLE